VIMDQRGDGFLPPSLAADADRLARSQREAEVLGR